MHGLIQTSFVLMVPVLQRVLGLGLGLAVVVVMGQNWILIMIMVMTTMVETMK